SLPLIRQHGRNIRGRSSDTRWTSTTCQFHLTSNLQNANSDTLCFARYHESVGEPGRVAPVGRRRHEHAELAKHEDRKSTRLNSSHLVISYAVFCLKKKKKTNTKKSVIHISYYNKLYSVL